MTLTFARLGLNEQQIIDAQKYGLTYKKYQKKQLLSANRIGKATEAEINELRSLFPEMPADYMEFLTNINGGTPSPNVIRTKSGSHVIREFFALSRNNIIPESINFQLIRFGKPLTKERIPIAETANGDTVFLNCNKESAGEILLWRHDSLHETGEAVAFSHIADSFTELLSSLTKG